MFQLSVAEGELGSAKDSIVELERNMVVLRASMEEREAESKWAIDNLNRQLTEQMEKVCIINN